MNLQRRNIGLALSALLFAGCGSDAAGTTSTTSTTNTTNTIPDLGMCGDAGAAVRYRVNALHIPTDDEANEGAVVGHNVDSATDGCNTPDYTGGVDNRLIDLAAAVSTIDPDNPVDLQAEIDAGLECAAGSATCSRLDVIVSVRRGTGCVEVEVEDATGASLAGPFVGTLDGAGNMRGQAPTLALTIPFRTDTGTVDIDLTLSGLIVTGTLTESGLTNIVFGGWLVRSAFEATVMVLVEQLGFDFDEVGPLLATLYDVDLNGECAGLSVGLTGSAIPYNP